ncbi:MAG TPA: ATP-binding protein [Anaerolineales bacterium]|nr:ATP-binding protein [Anaerolineales bacterium]
MRSISTKLILAFVSIGLISVAVITFSARWNTRAEFIKFVSDRQQSDIATELTDYYSTTGSWDGADVIFIASVDTFNEPLPQNHVPPGPVPPFVLVDENGVVVVPNGQYQAGERIPAPDLAMGVSLTENGEVVGILVPIRVPFEGNRREQEFIQRTNLTFFYSALGAAIIALILGIVLSRTLTRPIRELTQATHAVSEGDLSQQVTVHSNDELGELAKAFNNMSAELSRSVNARKQMTADVAHELRTPLSLILGHAEAVHDNVLPPTRENFEIIREEALRLEHLVNDLRILSLADAGELTINPQTVEPGRLVNEVTSRYQVETQKKKISLHVDVAPHLPSLDVDPGRMTQVLTNIMDNALRHTPEGGKIHLSANEEGDDIEFSVQDSGPGVSPEDLDRIFERFYRSDSARQRDGAFPGGSGLGLAIAKSIVQAHGGQILAESETGQGLRVVVQLPKQSDSAN